MTCLAALCLIGALAVDGDTLRAGDLRVRIWGIDAPERMDPYGPASSAAMAALIDGKVLACDDRGPDRYGRTVSRCVLPDGRDIACVMVAAGQAKDWPRYSKGAYAACNGSRPPGRR
ncbi:thermonuclease family protein [Paracoccus suum]|uniref:Thermonuclease family protein n=1 Tax=Paracoccus suum TaxID=2259340 RepID=A0A344PKX0_9RHOB|nr:thermonuclease family protein [Paracoccus suum]AXC50025.1 thermonuclease family protein [Paracoccus suum]